ncbi:MAG: hypothetical protein IKJ45_10840, partial [Kiritimatiellae bacterium]|nr:hypothetical protein [Kiritimatiellia bacterium]
APKASRRKMSTLLDEYNEWNNPIVGAYLLWKFSLGYVNTHREHLPPPMLLHFIVIALLRGRVYSEYIDHAMSLHGYAAKFVKDGYADKLEELHGRVQSHLPYAMKSIDMAVSRKMLIIDTENASLIPVEIPKVQKGTRMLSPSVQKLGKRAEKLGKWMSPLELSTIAIDLGVKF